MPTYEYACTDCGQHVEVFQRFSDEPLTTCGVCGGPLRKVFHPAGILFRGSGFYSTDNRAKQKATATSEGSSASAQKADAGGEKAEAGGEKADAGGEKADAGGEKAEAASGSKPASRGSDGSGEAKEKSA